MPFDDAHQPALAVGPRGEVALAMIQRGNIVVALSTDGGRSFSAPVIAVDGKGQLRGGRQRGPRLAFDGRGNLTLTAPATFDPEEQKKRYPAPELVLVQAPAGTSVFSAPIRVNPVPKRAPEGLHALRVAADGTGHVSWLDISERSGPGQDLFYARLVGGKLVPGPVIARTVCECCAPGLALDGKGNPTVVWREGGLKDSREVFYRRSTDGGKTFGPVVRLNTDPTKETGCPMSAPAVLVSADGQRLWSAWKHVNRREAHISWREATSNAPDTDLQSQPGGTQDHPALVLGDGGEWAAVWEENRGGPQAVWFRTASSPARPLSQPSDGAAAFPVLVSVGGKALVAYETKQGERLSVRTLLP